MDLTQLEMLVATVEAGGVQKAAAKVFRTQPAVSMALRKLEQEIGGPIFDRSVRSAYVLTPQGRLLYDCGKKLLRLRDETLAEIRSLRELQSGRLKVGANESTGNYLLPRLIKNFHGRHPQIKVEVIRNNSASLLNDVKEDLVDLAFISFLPEDDAIEATAMMNDPLVLITSTSHPLCSKRGVHIRDLGNEQFIAHSVRTPSRTRVVEAFEKFNTPLRISMEVSSLEIIKRLVAMGPGVGFVPLMCVREETERGEIARIPVEGFEHERSLWMIRRKAHAHTFSAQEFAKLVKDDGTAKKRKR
jgi:DNA-binding transcriptional LysR family regulator